MSDISHNHLSAPPAEAADQGREMSPVPSTWEDVALPPNSHSYTQQRTGGEVASAAMTVANEVFPESPAHDATVARQEAGIEQLPDYERDAVRGYVASTTAWKDVLDRSKYEMDVIKWRQGVLEQLLADYPGLVGHIAMTASDPHYPQKEIQRLRDEAEAAESDHLQRIETLRRFVEVKAGEDAGRHTIRQEPLGSDFSEMNRTIEESPAYKRPEAPLANPEDISVVITPGMADMIKKSGLNAKQKRAALRLLNTGGAHSIGAGKKRESLQKTIANALPGHKTTPAEDIRLATGQPFSEIYDQNSGSVTEPSRYGFRERASDVLGRVVGRLFGNSDESDTTNPEADDEYVPKLSRTNGSHNEEPTADDIRAQEDEPTRRIFDNTAALTAAIRAVSDSKHGDKA